MLLRRNRNRNPPYLNSSHRSNVINAGTNGITTFTVKENINEIMKLQAAILTTSQY